jgi:hypothetical protein
VRSDTAKQDSLIARDLKAGTERVVTDMRSDGSSGWQINGYDLSPDRTRIVLASLYGPTQADNDTKLATNRLWSLATDGTDFRRLTPVFDNTGAGKTNFSIEVRDPVFSLDGASVLYDFGNYWYEGTSLKGGSAPWGVSSAGNGVPSLFPTQASCTIVSPSFNPATGDVVLIHSVCVNSSDVGIFSYPKAGGAPTKLVAQAYGVGFVRPSLEAVSWIVDGSGFIFPGLTDVQASNTTNTVRALFAYSVAKNAFSAIVLPQAGETVQNAAISKDAQTIVYCVRHADSTTDLHVVDLTPSTPTDTALTTDGKSCSPKF